MLIKFVDNTKLGGVANIWEGREKFKNIECCSAWMILLILLCSQIKFSLISILLTESTMNFSFFSCLVVAVYHKISKSSVSGEPIPWSRISEQYLLFLRPTSYRLGQSFVTTASPPYWHLEKIRLNELPFSNFWFTIHVQFVGTELLYPYYVHPLSQCWSYLCEVQHIYLHTTSIKFARSWQIILVYFLCILFFELAKHKSYSISEEMESAAIQYRKCLKPYNTYFFLLYSYWNNNGIVKTFQEYLK